MWTSPLQGHLTVLTVTVCHTAGHNGDGYDDWNSAVLRSWRNCSSDGTEWTDDGRAFQARTVWMITETRYYHASKQIMHSNEARDDNWVSKYGKFVAYRPDWSVSWYKCKWACRHRTRHPAYKNAYTNYFAKFFMECWQGKKRREMIPANPGSPENGY